MLTKTVGLDDIGLIIMFVPTLGPGRPSPGGPLPPVGPLGPSTPCKDKQMQS